jgi:sugar/nucleoside kinase (ribokinase family)
MLAIGHILVDTIGNVDAFPEELQIQGPKAIHIDAKAMAATLELIRQKSENGSAHVSRNLGGGAAVTSMIAATLGMKVAFKGSIGSDPEGEFLRKKLQALGVDFTPSYSEQRSGTFLSLVDSEGRRMLMVCPAAARDVRGVKIDDAWLAEGSMLYLDGLLIDSYRWLSDIARRAKEKGMNVAMDFSTPGNAIANAVNLRRFAREYCDVVFANALETQAVYGSGDRSGLDGGSFIFIEKRGAEGAILWHEGKSIRMKTAVGFMREDTCAGDALAAGFLKAWSEGRDLDECLSTGMAAASVAIQFEGSGYDVAMMQAAVMKTR